MKMARLEKKTQHYEDGQFKFEEPTIFSLAHQY
jgi:hypothetical protein